MDPLFVKDGPALRRWLEKHASRKEELWVGLWKGGAFGWKQLVDEVLCFGWIDGVRKSIDDERWMIRITPRKPRSIWSQINIARMEALIAEGRVTPRGLAAYQARDLARAKLYSYERAAASLTPDEEAAIRANKKAWAFFDAQPPGRKKVIVHWVTSGKQAATRARRLAVLIACSAKGELIPPLRY